MLQRLSIAIFFLLLFSDGLQAQDPSNSNTRVTLESPDHRIHAEVYQEEQSDGKKHLYYKVSYRDRPVILTSGLDIRMDNHIMESALGVPPDTAADWCADLLWKGTTVLSRDTAWKPLYGERSLIRDQYNEVTVNFEKQSRPKYQMQLILRVYDAGVALRYYFPENPTGIYYHITAENTDFTLPENTTAYFTPWAQGVYKEMPLRNWPDEAERPLTLRLEKDLYACLAEAQMVDYARTKFVLSPDKPNTIRTAIFGAVDGITYFGTPWRVILIGQRPGDLVEHEDLLLNLNPPSTLVNTGWIRPGKSMREMTLTTEGAKATIDFAAQHHIQYILFDAGWYGPQMTFTSDAARTIPHIDMPEVVKYAGQKNIGVWLYVNMLALSRQLDTILPLYHRWGIKGVKFGFVEVGSQYWTTWLEEGIRKAAANQLMVDIHDEFRPTGEQRTWPNLLSAEGVRGNEEMPDATHNTIQPFTRFIAGPADYTICYYDHRIRTTHAHQLALSVVFYMPLQTLFWYDKPSAYHGEPEVEFFDKVPVAWEETKVLDGIPGQYITTARRSGNDWFVGTITNDSARTLRLALNFLPSGKKYTASIYSDDPSVQTATHVKVERRKVDAATTLDIKLLPSGGQAIWLTPVK